LLLPLGLLMVTSILLKTRYWLTLLHRTSYIEDNMYTSMKKDLDEIIRIIVKTLKTTRKNEKNKV
jgi:hypothetical protein